MEKMYSNETFKQWENEYNNLCKKYHNHFKTKTLNDNQFKEYFKDVTLFNGMQIQKELLKIALLLLSKDTEYEYFELLNLMINLGYTLNNSLEYVYIPNYDNYILVRYEYKNGCGDTIIKYFLKKIF